MIKQKDIEEGLIYGAELVEKWFWIGIRGAVRIAKRHKPVIKEAVSDVKTVVDFVDERL